MKKLIVVFAFFIISNCAFSQNSKGDILLGGNLSLEDYSGRSSTLYCNLIGGYYFTDRFSAGTTGSMALAFLAERTLNMCYLDPYLRYNIVNKKVQVFTGIGGLYAFGNDGEMSEIDPYFKPKVLVGTGYSLTPNFGIHAVLDAYLYKRGEALAMDRKYSIFFVFNF